MWDPLRSGIEPVSPGLAGKFFTTEPPRTPYLGIFKNFNLIYLQIFLKYSFVYISVVDKVLILT